MKKTTVVETEVVHLSLKTGEIVIDRNKFAEFITLTKNFLYASNHEHADIFTNELSGEPFVNSFSNWQMGVWRLEANQGRLELIRVPPRGEIMYFFVAHLGNTDDTWFVSSIDTRKMKQQ